MTKCARHSACHNTSVQYSLQQISIQWLLSLYTLYLCMGCPLFYVFILVSLTSLNNIFASKLQFDFAVKTKMANSFKYWWVFFLSVQHGGKLL